MPCLTFNNNDFISDEIEEKMKEYYMKMTCVRSTRAGPEFLSVLKFTFDGN